MLDWIFHCASYWLNEGKAIRNRNAACASFMTIIDQSNNNFSDKRFRLCRLIFVWNFFPSAKPLERCYAHAHSFHRKLTKPAIPKTVHSTVRFTFYVLLIFLHNKIIKANRHWNESQFSTWNHRVVFFDVVCLFVVVVAAAV